jgi:hypothetical protein
MHTQLALKACFDVRGLQQSASANASRMPMCERIYQHLVIIKRQRDSMTSALGFEW